MNITKHRNCNGVLEADPADRNDVVDLPVCCTTMEFAGYNGVPFKAAVTQSFWKPTPEELVCLIEGGCVVLAVLGPTSPPVFVGAIPE